MSESTADPGPVDVVRLRTAAAQRAQLVGMHEFIAAHPPAAAPWRACSVCGLTLLRYEVHGCDLDRLEAKLDTLETLVREIRHALSAGAVGRWQDLGPRP